MVITFLRRVGAWVTPPPNWRIPVLFLLAALIGTGAYGFYISRAWSYLLDDPAACVNCHVMAPHYATWQHSSHGQRATCNDCHVPHNNIVNQYLTKGQDGMRHAYVFTLRNEPAIIRLNENAERVVQNNCLRCHENVSHQTSVIHRTGSQITDEFGAKCWDCHREVPHGRVSSQASVPDARVPVLQSPVPGWLQRQLEARLPAP